ncbi:MAG: hypothetical protein CVU60_11905 [Deltaproteobacteria bacterium HGW-Deltaproteobacteria-18]|jgi:hypothetical protein|nr:MAG: hypothetical protein CVU63_15280 [Deltaproteobacteria bacterium HGW-Deltaproteobacteria-20]PKN41146.1 MAG: hypothetical protein CVU60_11905 [Deltaproteobacteria bacterium HGW-Deltaproteobacteria-18]
MNEAFVSVLDILENDPSGAGLRPIREDLLNMDMDIRRNMDRGLAPDEMTTARTSRAMIQAAESILNKLSS